MGRKKLKADVYIKLQKIAEEIELKNANRDILDDKFSRSKTLFDYQVGALQNGIKILWKYFEDLKEDKAKFVKLYEDTDVYDDLHIDLKSHKFSGVLREFFKVEELNRREVIPFREISNRMSFWMATGSGKTLVIIKLIEILHTLMENGLIPQKEILFLTYRDDLLKAFKKHVEEYNALKEMKKQLYPVSLKDYEREVKQKTLSRRVFFYRSDLLSNERKENILNFRDFLTLDRDEKPFGNWYVILDEAHKGDTQESKRQAIFSILSQKGFLFNFSATFTEPIDIVTTVYNLNLNEFIKKGYGKQVYVLQENASAFRDKSDFSKEEKRKIILKNFILLSAVKRAYKKIKEAKGLLYHNPLSVFLVNSVNTANSDLFLVFKEIESIGKKIESERFEEAKKELLDELGSARYTLGEKDYTLSFLKEILSKVKLKDIYPEVFNSKSGGNIEYIVNRDNKQEILLKLDSSDRPFALIKIGNIANWIKEKLIGYKSNDSFEGGSYFENLNTPESSVNLLLGSRAFYEGWDSNRPNLITFINIGTGTDAKKFVVQSVGRGIRIEPMKGKRKRISALSLNDKQIGKLYENYKNECRALETLFITATNKGAVETVLTELELVKKAEGFEEIGLWENEKVNEKPLYVPVYRKELKRIFEDSAPPKFEMSKENLEFLENYFKFVPEERFILERNATFQDFTEVKKLIDNHRKFIRTSTERHYRNGDFLIDRLISYLSFEREEISGFSSAKEKIVHFRKVKVKTSYKEQFLKLAEKVKNATFITDDELFDMVASGEINKEEFKRLKESQKFIEQELDYVKLRKLAQHFYIPLVYSEKKVEWIKHIIPNLRK